MYKKDILKQYLLSHNNRWNRLLHKLGFTGGALVVISVVCLELPIAYALCAIPVTYAINWLGHSVFEKNAPLTFDYPVESFVSYWKMIFMSDAKRKKIIENDN